jgi:hypothetical protein
MGRQKRDRTYGDFDSTVFDVRRDFIRMLNDMISGDLISKFTDKRTRAIKLIVQEVSQRMKNATRTLPEALLGWDGC